MRFSPCFPCSNFLLVHSTLNGWTLKDRFTGCGVQNHFWTNPFLSHFGPIFGPKWPLSRHFGIFHGPKRVPTGAKLAKNTCLSIPSCPGSNLKKFVLDPFLTHFLSQISPFSRHFGIFHGPARVTKGSKRAKNTCWSIPSGLETILEITFFSPCGCSWTHRWPPPCAGRAALPAGSTK